MSEDEDEKKKVDTLADLPTAARLEATAILAPLARARKKAVRRVSYYDQSTGQIVKTGLTDELQQKLLMAWAELNPGLAEVVPCVVCGDKFLRKMKHNKAEQRVVKTVQQIAPKHGVKMRSHNATTCSDDCVREKNRKWRAANLEKARELRRKRYVANPEKAREKAREQKRKQYAANPEKMREKNRKWRAANPENVREKSRKWAAANPEKAREQARKRARKRYAANLEKVREQARKRRAANREKVLKKKRGKK